MKRINCLLLSCFVFFGCEEEKHEDVSQIVLVQAPERIPYIFNMYRPQPYETTAVRFIARLDPPIDDVDTLFCRVFDPEGYRIDSFSLFDDGSLAEHWDRSSCEGTYTGDSLAGDGLFSSRVYSREFSANYPGAVYRFVFHAKSEERTVAETTHDAITWTPVVELDYVETDPELLPLCVPTLTLSAGVRCAAPDSIVLLQFGFGDYHGRVEHVLTTFIPVSGDSVWRGTVSRDNENWSHLDRLSLHIEAQTALGGWITWRQDSEIPIAAPEPGMSHAQDSIWLSSFGTVDTLLIKCTADFCPELDDEPLGCEFEFHESNDSLTAIGTGDMNDCGWEFDSLRGDGIFTGALFLSSENLSEPTRVQLSYRASNLPQNVVNCQNAGLTPIGTRVRHRSVVVLPPQ